jgi:hypothetical protein
MLSPQVLQAAQMLQNALRDNEAHWLIGGSCGLQFHGIELAQEPRDLDIYLDTRHVDLLHDALQGHSLDKPENSTTDIYTSMLSHYLFAGMQVEAVGGFSIRKKGSLYRVEASYLMKHHALRVQMQEAVLCVMPLAHELLFNLLRDRPDRYRAIAVAMLQESELHMPALKDLLTRNQWEPEFLSRLDELLETALHSME